MHLSPVYQRVFWVMVYHTQPDSEEVELVTNKLFLSKKKALKWFARKRRAEHFVQPEAVMATGFTGLSIRPDRVGPPPPHVDDDVDPEEAIKEFATRRRLGDRAGTVVPSK